MSAGSPAVIAADVSSEEHARAAKVLESKAVAILIVAYNAEKYLESVVARIPAQLRPLFTEIFVIDDSSTDATYSVASRLHERFPGCNLKAYRTPFNRGYGGNQKLGYLYCIEQGYDYVVLLHGDGQYAPEYLPRVLAGLHDGPDAVFASRMIDRRQALRGGMPLYKWVGNQVLTALQNRLLGTNLSEFHTGFRAYSVQALARIPFAFNTDGFHFDTEIVIQCLARGWRIKEVSIPTHYGDEVCYVNGFRYAKDCMASVLRYRLTGLGLFYERNFDFGLFEEDNYQFKLSPHSLHQYVLKRVELSASTVSLELGANHGLLSSHIASRVRRHVAVDLAAPDRAGASETLALDLNGEFARRLPDRQYDCCVALDVIEHLDSPEGFLLQLGSVIKTGGKVYLSTANITYVLMRLALLVGQFNYGKRGILDRTHKRLFGVRSFAHLLRQHGYRLDEVRGFPPPLTDLVSGRHVMKLVERVHAWLARRMPRLFAYNFLVVATRQDSINQIFAMTVAAASEKSPANAEQPQKYEGATSA